LYRVNKRDAFNGNSATPVTLPTDSLETLVTISDISKGLANKKSNVSTIVHTSHGIMMGCKDQSVTIIDSLSKLSQRFIITRGISTNKRLPTLFNKLPCGFITVK
jgi:hypothetical protein